MAKTLFKKIRKAGSVPVAKTNFSCNLFTETEFDPFQGLADDVGLDKTAYFRLMLRRELKEKRIQKMILGGKLKK